MYHGVRIQDRALVAAAECLIVTSLIVLPDKAIDLVDQACATIRTEWDQIQLNWIKLIDVSCN